MMYSDLFNGLVNEVMEKAVQEAHRFCHDSLRPEHVLLALTKCDRGVAFQVFQALDQDPRRIRFNLEKLLDMGPPEAVVNPLPQAPELQNVFALAYEAIKSWKHSHLTTGHLLVGLLTNGGDYSVAREVLQGLGVTLDGVQGMVLRVLRQPNQDEELQRGTFILTSEQMTWLLDQKQLGEYTTLDEALTSLIQRAMAQDKLSLAQLVAKYDAVVSRGDEQAVQDFLNSEVAQANQEFIAIVTHENNLLWELEQAGPLMRGWVLFLESMLGIPLTSPMQQVYRPRLELLEKLTKIRLANAKTSH